MEDYKIGYIALFSWILKMGLLDKINAITKTYFPIGTCKMDKNGEHHVLLVNTICKILHKGQEISSAKQVCAVCSKKTIFKCN